VLRQYFSFRLANSSFHDVGGQSMRLSNALMLNSFISISILLYKIICPFLLPLNPFSLFALLFFGVILLYLIKMWAISLINSITEASGILNKAHMHSSLYYQVVGVLLLPGVIAILFFPVKTNVSFFLFPDENINIGYIYSIFVFAILYVFKLFQSIRQSFDIKISWSYIILYLCTLEILPLVVLYRLLVGKFWAFN